MTFDEVLAQTLALLEKEGRVSYRALGRRFDLDEDYLEDLKAEIIDAKQVAIDENGKVLVWRGKAGLENEAPGPAASPTTSQVAFHPNDAERRQLTVMFCDIVGSTELSEQLDPEELREIVRAYQHTCAQVIDRFDGHIAQYLGDGLLVYFGYPRAHEDDAERAVRAGLGLVDALQELNTRLPRPIRVRVGVHTGQVVVGEMGSGVRHEHLALGETPNIAARVQGLAADNAVVMSAATQQLVAGLFTSESLGAHSVKGIALPLSLYQVSGEGDVHSRFEAAVKTGLTAMVGREEEVGLLQRHWAEIKDGNGQVVLLSGEAGIGKSRLVQFLKEHVLHDRTTRIEFRCSPYYRNSAFYPIVGHLERMLKFVPQEAGAAKYEKLARLLSRYDFPRADTLPLLAELLSLPLPDGCAALELSPERQKQRTLETLVAWILEDAERHDVYCAWEDLHWSDASTMEALELLLEHVSSTRLLVMLTFRPDFRPPWELRSHFSHITLSRLGRSQVEQLIDKLTDGKALPPEVLQQIVTKTDGVPLFVEELTKMVMESGLLRAANEHYELKGPLPPLAIPSTLQDSLMARLDRLASARELAQLGATLGREFTYDLICAVSPLDEAALQSGLAQLVEAELIYRKGLPPNTSYLFKHALVQDTAYQSLLKSQRQQFHQRITHVLEERFPDVVARQPELLAHHYAAAGLPDRAIPYWQEAGHNSVQRSANSEAIGHYTSALEALQILPPGLERNRRELALQVALSTPVAVSTGWSSGAAGKVYNRARELCAQVGDTPQLFPTLYGLWSVDNMQANYVSAHETAVQFLDRAELAADAGLLIEAHVATGFTAIWLGQFRSALEHCEAGISLYDPDLHRVHVDLYRREPGTACRGIAAWSLWHLGYPDQALKSAHEGIALAGESRHPYSVAYAEAFICMTHQFRGDAAATHVSAEALMTLGSRHGFPFWSAWGACLGGWSLAVQGQAEAGIAQIREGLVAYRAVGAEMGRSYILALIADAQSKAGLARDGLATLVEASAFVEQTDERYYEPELHRLKGELILQSPTTAPQSEIDAQAEACFHVALDVARRHQAKSLELRAATSLARLWQRQDKLTEAGRLLGEIHDSFKEGFETRDLQEAKRLLGQLA